MWLFRFFVASRPEHVVQGVLATPVQRRVQTPFATRFTLFDLPFESFFTLRSAGYEDARGLFDPRRSRQAWSCVYQGGLESP
jgi:hypothetical protein